MKKLNIKVIKNNFFKYTLIIITFSFIFFLSSCNEKKNNYEIYTTLIEELKAVNDKIETYYSRFEYKVESDDKAATFYRSESKSSYVKSDLTYVTQSYLAYTDDGVEDAYTKYSFVNDDVYLVEKKEKKPNGFNNDDKEYTFTKVDNITLKDILGITSLESLVVNDYNGDNGKLEKYEFEVASGRYRYCELEVKYSLLKNNKLIDEIFSKENLSFIRDCINDDSVFVFYYNLYDDIYSFDIVCHFAKDDKPYTVSIGYYKATREAMMGETHNMTYNNEFTYHQNKTILLDEDTNVNLIPHQDESINFTPNYSGYYDIILNFTNPVKVTIQNEEYTGSNIKLTKLLKSENQTNKTVINIEGLNDLTEGNIRISYSDEIKLDNIQMGEYDEYITKIGFLEGIKKIITNDSNVGIQNLILRKNLDGYHYNTYNCYPSSQLSYNFSDDIYKNYDYYVVLKNLSDLKIDNVNISLAEVDTLDVNSSNVVKVDGKNRKYFKVQNANNSSYRLNVIGEYIDLDYYDSDSEYLFIDSNSFIIESNETYYISLVCDKETVLQIEFIEI